MDDLVVVRRDRPEDPRLDHEVHLMPVRITREVDVRKYKIREIVLLDVVEEETSPSGVVGEARLRVSVTMALMLGGYNSLGVKSSPVCNKLVGSGLGLYSEPFLLGALGFGRNPVLLAFGSIIVTATHLEIGNK